MPKKVPRLSLPDWPEPTNPVSRVVEGAGLVFVSGQAGIRPGQARPVPGGITAETRQSLDNVGTLLRAVGLGFADVVKTTVYLADFGDFEAMNEVYRAYFLDEPPVRFTTGVTGLLNGARIEIEVIAVR
jgi:2-iminobutanoate/2-iminopropanoate deaminase